MGRRQSERSPSPELKVPHISGRVGDKAEHRDGGAACDQDQLTRRACCGHALGRLEAKTWNPELHAERRAPHAAYPIGAFEVRTGIWAPQLWLSTRP